MTKPRIGLYPGTFDPITHGHTDIILRGARLVDRLIVCVALNTGKTPVFTTEERVEMVREEIDHLADTEIAKRIEVRSYNDLTTRYAASVGATVVVRGLRAVSDFEYEAQMAGLNAHLNPDLETVFLMASDRFQAIASKFIREISQLGGDVSAFVSPRVVARLRAHHGGS